MLTRLVPAPTLVEVVGGRAVVEDLAVGVGSASRRGIVTVTAEAGRVRDEGLEAPALALIPGFVRKPPQWPTTRRLRLTGGAPMSERSGQLNVRLSASANGGNWPVSPDAAGPSRPDSAVRSDVAPMAVDTL